MRGFVPVPEGWASRLDVWEREFIAGLLQQVEGVLAVVRATGSEEHTGGMAARTGTSAREGESEADAAVLASLDFTTPDAQDPGNAGEPRRDAPAVGAVPASLVPLVEVLLPDASEDPGVAVEVAGMTRDRLRDLKHERLGTVVTELLEPTGAAGAVLVARGQEPTWLGALNDARLVLAERLGIKDAEDADDVHAAAYEETDEDAEEEDARARWERGLALAYDMITWWQESLVAVLLRSEQHS